MSHRLRLSALVCLLGLASLLGACRCGAEAECDAVDCGEFGRCEVQDGQATCVCSSGWAGEHCETCAIGHRASPGGLCIPAEVCASDSCGAHASCEDAGGIVECVCDLGYSGEDCDSCDVGYAEWPQSSGNCVADLCDPDPCAGANQVAGSCALLSATEFSCACNAGYDGTLCDRCAAGYHDEGSGVCVEDQACLATTCNGHGLCDDSGGNPVCSCDLGYVDDNCDACDSGYAEWPVGSATCVDDPCEPDPCTGLNEVSGSCTQTAAAEAGCLCQTGYAGSGCGACDVGYAEWPPGSGSCAVDPCSGDPCSDAGQVAGSCQRVGASDHTCECASGFYLRPGTHACLPIAVSGTVTNLAGAPLAGVEVSIEEYPFYGTALTDTQGLFTLQADGRGFVTLVYRKAGFVGVARELYVPFDAGATAPVVALAPVDDVATELSLSQGVTATTVHEASTVVDGEGSRACTLVFPIGITAQALDVQGSVVGDIDLMTVRATEISDVQALPGLIPDSFELDYCVEIGADGVERVSFSAPVTVWIDNFRELPTGQIVPIDTFDIASDAWHHAADARVVTLLDRNRDGEADALDANGDGAADDLDGDGSLASEVRGLAGRARFQPEASFWRFEVDHFSAFSSRRCAQGYQAPSCDSCAAGYSEWPAGSGRCVDDPCEPSPCTDPGYEAGTCAQLSELEGRCDCAPGYLELPIGSGVCVQDLCAPDPCVGSSQIAGSCVQVTAASYRCACEPGYRGDLCDLCAAGHHDDGSGDCVADSNCLPGTCGGGGSCDDSSGSPVCSCTSGYSGSHCEACAVGFTEWPAQSSTCLDDPCLPDPCAGAGLQAGSCEQTGATTYSCDCAYRACGNACCAQAEACVDGACCQPETCAGLGKGCGSWADGCGGELECGLCGSGFWCDAAGACTCDAEICNGICCAPGQVCDAVGACCSAQSCEDDGRDCGVMADGCGHQVDCGNCNGQGTCTPAGSCICDFASCNGECCAQGDICVPSGCCTASGFDDADCDGIDDDCDGLVDEDYAPDASCVVGACLASGAPSACVGGIEVPCDPGIPPSSYDSTCDGVDDDCDGAVDDNFQNNASVCGIGACQSSGAIVCSGGQIANTCTPGSPGAEVCGDGIDGDCDGEVDDGCPDPDAAFVDVPAVDGSRTDSWASDGGWVDAGSSNCGYCGVGLLCCQSASPGDAGWSDAGGAFDAGGTLFECINPNWNSQHCGACGQACRPGENCDLGVCECPAPSRQICGEVCVDVFDDASNCGGCGYDCAFNEGKEVCISGTCRNCSEFGYVLCDGRCVDPASFGTDSFNCGSCGSACDPEQACVSGVCVSGLSCGWCGVGSLCCESAPLTDGGYPDTAAPDVSDRDAANADGASPDGGGAYRECVGPLWDERHCGACGQACLPGETCSSGTCVCPAPSRMNCAGQCIDVFWDEANCGGCSYDCAIAEAKEVCYSGSCYNCSDFGQVLCGGECVDPASFLSDPYNCGDCGQPCAAEQACVNGSCVSGLVCGYCAVGRICCQAGPAFDGGYPDTGPPDTADLDAANADTSSPDASGYNICVDPLWQTEHCGACGQSCIPGQSCDYGNCVCPAPHRMMCGGLCIDVYYDRDNCGSCGYDCLVYESKEICRHGVCRDCSELGQVYCAGSCYYPSSFITDPFNCGGCGVRCGVNQACVGGTCISGDNDGGYQDGATLDGVSADHLPQDAGWTDAWQADSAGVDAGQTDTFSPDSASSDSAGPDMAGPDAYGEDAP